jgi:hypothetical protein
MPSNRYSREASALAILLASQLLLIQQVFKRFLPVTDGWYMGIAQAAKSHLLYKEIDFPMPIGAVFFEGVIPNLFDNPIVAEQYIHSISWLIFSVAFYSIIRFAFSRYVTLVVSVTVLTFYFVQPGNIISGYFELMYMFYFLGWGFLLWSTSKIQSYKYTLLLGGSIFLTTSVAIKQTAILPVVCSLIFYLWWAWKSERDSFVKTATTISIGVSGPFFAVLVWSLKNGVFVAMLQSMSGQGKNPGGLSIISTFGSTILPGNYLLLTFFATGILAITCFDLITILHKVLMLVAFWILFIEFSGIAILSTGNFSALQGYIFFFSFVFLVNLCSKTFTEKFSHCTKIGYVKLLDFSLLLALAFFPLVAFALHQHTPDNLLSPDWSTWFVGLGTTASSKFLVCGLASLVFVQIAKKRKVVVSFFEIPKSRFDFFANFLLISTMTFFFMNSFAGGPGVEVFALNIAIVLGIILQAVHFNFGKRVFVCCVLGFLIPWNIGASAMQIENPYSWYQLDELSLDSERLSPIAPRLSSFSLSTTSANDYNLLYQGVTDAQNLTQGKQTEVYFGSRNLGLASMFDVEIYPTRCPVIWWDICPESSAIENFNQLKSSPPLVVVWTFESDNNIVSNENGWRTGKSTVSKIQTWLLREIGLGNYRVIAETHKLLDRPNESQVLTRVLVRTD